MCGLCGVLGADEHWANAAAHPQTFAASASRRTPRQERLNRVALANQILRRYGLKLRDFQGTSYVLSSRTGRTQMVDHLSALWPIAEVLAGRPCDPLEASLIDSLDTP